MLLVQLIRWAFSLALARAGNSMDARMAMMAMTTSSSINVNALDVQTLFSFRMSASCMNEPDLSVGALRKIVGRLQRRQQYLHGLWQILPITIDWRFGKCSNSSSILVWAVFFLASFSLTLFAR